MGNSATEDIAAQLLPVLKLGNIFLPKGKQNTLTPQEFQVLVFICSVAERLQAPITPRSIALLLVIDRTRISQILGSLENQGLITRRYDPTLWRTLIIPTEQGARFFRAERDLQVKNLHTLVTCFYPLGMEEDLARILQALLPKIEEKVRGELQQAARKPNRPHV